MTLKHPRVGALLVGPTVPVAIFPPEPRPGRTSCQRKQYARTRYRSTASMRTNAPAVACRAPVHVCNTVHTATVGLRTPAPSFPCPCLSPFNHPAPTQIALYWLPYSDAPADLPLTSGDLAAVSGARAVLKELHLGQVGAVGRGPQARCTAWQ